MTARTEPGPTLVVFHVAGVGGPARSLIPIVSRLADDGRVECLVPEDGWASRAYAELGPVTTASYSSLVRPRGASGAAQLAPRLRRDVRGFRALYRRRRPERVIVVTTRLPTAVAAARLEGLPCIVYAAELYGHAASGAPLPGTAARLFCETMARYADGLICCSGAVARQFPARGTPVTVSYPPISPSLADGDRDRGRAALGLRDEPCVAVVGNLSLGRGQDVALRSLKIVRASLPDARLVVVGEPHPRRADREYARSLRELTAALGLADAVTFRGVADEMADVYAAADVVVNPARVAEAFGRVAPEALVAGTPVIASRVGAVEEVLRDGETGLLVPPEDPRALADAALHVLGDPDLGRRMVVAGRADALARFSEARDVAAWISLLERVGAQKAPRPLTTA